MKLLGIDIVFFEVLDLQKANKFYQQLGFTQQLVIPKIKAILFSIGEEEPGLIICEKDTPTPSKVWIEVENAEEVKFHCQSLGILGTEIQATTGLTFEIVDDAGNVLGFADYSKKPELSRGFQDNQQIKSIAEDYAERIWNEKDLSAIADHLDESIIIHSLLGDFHGTKAMEEVVKAWLKAFPDLTVHHELVISENDIVNIQWRAKGTHIGEFKGIPPTGRTVSYGGMTVYRIKNRKIVEYWAYLDMQHLLSQMIFA